MKIGDLLKNHTYLKVFLKGQPGTGKTFLAASISKLFKTIFIDVEGGILSARKVMDTDMEIRLIREPDNKVFFDKLGYAMGEALSGKYEAIVVDSITEISGRMEAELAKGDGKLTIQDRGSITYRIKELGRKLRDAQAHVIVNALLKPMYREDDTDVYECALSGQSAVFVPSYFDTLALMRKVRVGAGKSAKTSHLFTTDGPSIYNVRDRNNLLEGSEPVDSERPERLWEKMIKGIRGISASAQAEAVAK